MKLGKTQFYTLKLITLNPFLNNAFKMGLEKKRKPQLAAKMPDHDLWIGFLKDLDGNIVGIVEEKSG